MANSKKSKTVTVFRSAVSGEFITKKAALKKPKQSVKETIKKKH